MSTKVRFLGIFVVLLFTISIFGCGPKPEKEKSVLDTPENHFSRGMVDFERGNLDQAMKEFQRAKALNPDYAEAFSGMALVTARQAQDTENTEASEDLFEEAIDLANKGIDKNDKSIDAHIIKGRVLTMQRKGDDWVEDAA
ncbi:tetratricopeptide repeat protein, partial [candidate division KSB1 bacterium]|nr:tetratricopeptide repeat protein [candidate division KSB1 bacterium]